MSAATNPGWLFAQQEKGIADTAQRRHPRAVHRRPLRHADRGRDGEDRPLRPRRPASARPTRRSSAPRRSTPRCGSATGSSTRPRPARARSTSATASASSGALPIDDGVQARSATSSPRTRRGGGDRDRGLRRARRHRRRGPRRRGLIDYVYKGPLDRAAADPAADRSTAGGRALMMSENNDGGRRCPWYHPPTTRSCRRRPYSFKRPASCSESRTCCRRAAAQPRPAIGAAVPDQPLDRHLAGAEALERGEGQHPRGPARAGSSSASSQRGLLANFVSVDFYREGDVFGAIDELNAARAAPNP